MVFLGKFRTNLRIPDYLGIGRLVSQGYGTIKRIRESPDTHIRRIMKEALLVIDVQNEYFTGRLPVTHPAGKPR